MKASVKIKKISNEFIEFIAKGTTPEEITQFQFSEETQERIENLVIASKTGNLTEDEQKELDEVLLIDHLITLAKAKAYQYIQSSESQD
jgi:GTP-dependent phosphoenolpyruvate carboxykinase